MSDEQGNKACPFCGETILTTAKKCKHCGKWLDQEKETARSSQSSKLTPEQVKHLTKMCYIWLNRIALTLCIGLFFLVSVSFIIEIFKDEMSVGYSSFFSAAWLSNIFFLMVWKYTRDIMVEESYFDLFIEH